MEDDDERVSPIVQLHQNCRAGMAGQRFSVTVNRDTPWQEPVSAVNSAQVISYLCFLHSIVTHLRLVVVKLLTNECRIQERFGS